MSSCADQLGINFGGEVITNLFYADDAVLLVRDPVHWPAMFNRFELVAKSLGLKPSWQKTKVQNVAIGPSPLPVPISGVDVESVDHFTDLGSNIHSSGY